MTEPEPLSEQISDTDLDTWLKQSRPVPQPERQQQFLTELAEALEQTPQASTLRLLPWRVPLSLVAAALAASLIALPFLWQAAGFRQEVAVEPVSTHEALKLGAAPPSAGAEGEIWDEAWPSKEREIPAALQPLQAHLADLPGLEWSMTAQGYLQITLPATQQQVFEQRLAEWPEAYHLHQQSVQRSFSGRASHRLEYLLKPVSEP